MKFKQWINGLSVAHLMALSYMCGLKNWKGDGNKRGRRTTLAATLVKSTGAREIFRDYKMHDIVTSAKADYVA